MKENFVTIRLLAAGSAAVIMMGVLPAFAVGFQDRAAGHAFQCGPHAVNFPKDGSPTLSTRDSPDILTATKTKWFAHRVKLSFGPGAPPIKLSEFGATVTLSGAGGSAVCVRMQ